MSLQIDWLETELDESISSPADSRAPTFHLRGDGMACPVSAAACGPSFTELSLKFDPVGQLLKMSLGLELSALIGCSLTWQEQTTLLGRWWWVLSMPELRTDDNGYGLLPTPTKERYGTRNNGCPHDGREEYATKGSPSLETMAKNGMLPTPTATDAQGRGYQYSKGDKSKPILSLSGAVGAARIPLILFAKNTPSVTTQTDAKTLTTVGLPDTPSRLLPTPKASDGRPKGSGGNRKSPQLAMLARRGMLPTAQARDWKGPQGRAYKGESEDLPAVVSNGPGTGHLSPCFVEWMMGYPEGWTDVGDTDENE